MPPMAGESATREQHRFRLRRRGQKHDLKIGLNHDFAGRGFLRAAAEVVA